MEASGDEDGFPIFLMHGTPGSRKGPRPRSIVLYRMGVRLISYDRPGYGDSGRAEGRSVVDAAADVEAIADKLGHDRFAVVGRSGGGPHALACAASGSLAGRVTRVAVLVTLAPPNAPDLDWLDGMNTHNLKEHSADHGTFIASLTARADLARLDPQTLLDQLAPELTPTDRKVVDDVAIGNLLRASYAEAVRTGANGWIDDGLAFRKGWGFEPSSIDVPVKIWHGEDDAFSPLSHARWLASQIPHAEVEIQPDKGHFGAVEILPRMLQWLAGQAPSGAALALSATSVR